MVNVLLLILRNPRTTIALPIAATLVAIVAVFLVPKTFTSSTLLMPPQKVPSGAAALVGDVAATIVGAGSADLGLRNPSELYVGILKGRTIADRLISAYGLKDIYDVDTTVDARKELAKRTTVSTARDGLIVISYEDTDPIRAADIANAYAKALADTTQTLAISEASRRRQFFEDQLRATSVRLADMEAQFRAIQERTGVLSIDAQARSLFEMAVWYRGQIAGKEMQIAGLRMAANDRNPDVLRAREELAALKAQLADIEKRSGARNGELLVTSGELPKASEEYLKGLREVKYQQTLYEFLAKQVEWAKLDEGRDSVVIQVVDMAAPPDKKSGPKRLLIVVTVLILTHLGAVAYVLMVEAAKGRAALDEQFRVQLDDLRKECAQYWQAIKRFRS
jgi:uncharacterized protein involved in exopolysaccharide biosynthesis